MLRTSERLAYTGCRWRWDVEFNLRLKPRHPALALRFGTLVHRALATYYKPGTKRGPRPAKTFEKLYAEDEATLGKFGFKDEDGKWRDALEIGRDMLTAYIGHYGKDDRWRVLATEMPFQVDVHHPETGRYLYTYVGTVDGVWEDVVTHEIWVPDHKTTGSDPTKAGANLWIDEQAGAYWSFGVDALRERGIIKPGHDLRGMLYNFMLKKADSDDRPENELGQKLNLDGTVSKRQPGPRFHREPVLRDDIERQRVRERATEQAHEMYLIRRGKLSAYKVPGPLHHPNCRGCPVRDACELHEVGADYEPVLASMVEWDPYSEHALYERN